MNGMIGKIGDLENREFHRLADFISTYCGIRMPPEKRTLVEGRLRHRLYELGISSFKDYCRHVFEEEGLEKESIFIIDAVTTNTTDFFREFRHFKFLAQEAIPRLAEQGRGRADSPLKIWSAASSTGAEAYSAAMVLADYAMHHRGLHFEIYATDICTEVLEIALRGVYSLSDLA